MVEREDGKKEALDLSRLADRHIRPGWDRNIHAAQGASADRVMAHLETFHAKTVDIPAVYAEISRAKDAMALYIDSRARLTEVLGLREGAQFGAIDGMRRERRWWCLCGKGILCIVSIILHCSRNFTNHLQGPHCLEPLAVLLQEPSLERNHSVFGLRPSC